MLCPVRGPGKALLSFHTPQEVRTGEAKPRKEGTLNTWLCVRHKPTLALARQGTLGNLSRSAQVIAALKRWQCVDHGSGQDQAEEVDSVLKSCCQHLSTSLSEGPLGRDGETTSPDTPRSNPVPPGTVQQGLWPQLPDSR